MENFEESFSPFDKSQPFWYHILDFVIGTRRSIRLYVGSGVIC